MSASIEPFERLMPKAIEHFWAARELAAKNQKAKGTIDQGNRANVTAGKNLDGFRDLVRELIIANGLSDFDVFTDGRKMLTIPGYFRPTKNWDLLIVRKNQLIAAIEFKSQVGPSFGNNFNNRVEEALGNASDIKEAFREEAFLESMKPFVGYFFVLEDCPDSRKRRKISSPHFPIFPEFRNTGYANRYEILCRRLVQEQLYDAVALVMTPQQMSPRWSDLSELTSARRFAINLAGKISSISLECP
ncbi:MAG: Type-2 restriction enzyme PaeR7I [Verrucomicrobia subdivision 3 bacterium]|nr:Type-2 restriction enzyme PaeR7I [Limisphaerales bacterium]